MVEDLPYSLEIDRLSVCQAPKQKKAGFQAWRNLLFMHWPVPVEKAQSLLPQGLELDLYQDQALLGIVPFEMHQVRPWWLPSWMSFTFLETNVRLYVLAHGQPGVYFLSLDAASWLAVQAARIGWGLPYFYAKMRNQAPSLSRIPLNSNPHFSNYTHQSLSYHSYRPKYRDFLLQKQKCSARFGHLDIEYRIGNALPESQLGSLEFFLLERYLLFVENQGQLYKGQVHHIPYPAYQAEVIHLDQSLSNSHGFGDLGSPLYVHASPGVDVDVFPLIQGS